MIETSLDLIFYYKVKPSLLMYITLTLLNYVTAAALTVYLLHDTTFDSETTITADETPSPSLFNE